MASGDETKKLIVRVVGVIILCILFSVAGMYINCVSDAPCSLMNDRLRKDNVPHELNYCTNIPRYMKVFLIATHLLAFALFPFAMHVFWLRAPQLEQMKAQSPFVSILGFSFLMVSIMGEIGWHVSQQWFYQEEYHILNFVFYFFFMLGIACWADGIKFKQSETHQKGVLDKLSDLADMLLFISPLVVTLVYGAGATIKAICPEAEFGSEVVAVAPGICSSLPPPSKIPIYILMVVEFTVLTVRLYKVLGNDWRVVWVPFFCVFVNLFFIFLLNANVSDIHKNPFYHTLHDLLGTELGVFIATLLVWSKTSAPEESREKSE